MTLSLAQRFWAKVAEPNAAGCRLWLASLDGGGYGHIKLGRKMCSAHRVAWELSHGPIPDGLFVLHHCDTKRCVNVAHLFLGTQRDNIQDCIAKRRFTVHKWTPQFGEQHPQHKLTQAQINTIRHRYAYDDDLTHTQLAKEYGISRRTVGDILNGITWKIVAV